MFDGWIYLKETENDFDTIEEAMIIRDKKNSEFPESNKKCSYRSCDQRRGLLSHKRVIRVIRIYEYM